MENPQIQGKIGLALSGGAALGLAHVGVIKYLEEINLRPTIITGVSVGAIVGALYAAGNSSSDITSFFKKIKRSTFLRWQAKKSGLFDLKSLKISFMKYLQSQNFDELKIPLYVGVTNLNSGQPEVVDQGDLFQWVVASSAFPMIFQYQKINGQLYADGGISKNLIVTPLLGKTDFIIASNLRPLEYLENESFKGLSSISQRVISINIHKKVDDEIKLADLYIEMTGINKFSLFKWNKQEELIQFGYEKTKEAFEAILIQNPR